MSLVQGRIVLKDVYDGQGYTHGYAQSPLVRYIFARAVQQAFGKQEELARFQLHIDGFIDIVELRIGYMTEGHALVGSDMRDRAAVRTRYDLHTRILHRDIVNGDPSGSVDRRLQRPEGDVLMSGDLGATGNF